MKKEELPNYLSSSLEGGALGVFLVALNGALTKGYSQARAYAAGFLALQNNGYSKEASGKWRKQTIITIRMEKMQKQDDDKRQVFGFFSIVSQKGTPIVDSQGDMISETDLEKSVYRYVKFSRMGDERHDERVKAILIESMMFSIEKQQALGIDLGFVGWWGGFEILDDALWQKFKSGEYESFSIGGTGRYEQLSM